MENLTFIGFFNEELLNEYKLALRRLKKSNPDIVWDVVLIDSGGDLYMNDERMKVFIRNVFL